jgi:hypothetical protein
MLGVIAVVFMAGISFNEMRRGEKLSATALVSLYSAVLSTDNANAQGWGCTTCSSTLTQAKDACLQSCATSTANAGPVADVWNRMCGSGCEDAINRVGVAVQSRCVIKY